MPSSITQQKIKYTKKSSTLLNLNIKSHVRCWWRFQVDDEAMDLNKELMSKLLELDDVDAVYMDQK